MDSIEDIEDALSITIPTSDSLQVEDCRRLTGPGFLWDHPGAVVQLELRNVSAEKVVDLWKKNARRVMDAIAWHDQQITARTYDGGVNLALSAPIDQLYSAVFAAQTAMHFSSAELLGKASGDFDSMIKDLQNVMQREANPVLIALVNAAEDRGIDALSDDETLSLGHGAGAKIWPMTSLPGPEDVDWKSLHNVPLAMITGTNGKTTTTRLCAAIARAAGKVSGLTSTDFVRVGDEVLDRGDYSGPGGARLLLRDKRLELGFLEVARGGILRRGLPTRKVRAAVVTNVAADHLGQYGVNTLPELARAKFAVHRALTEDGVLVLNADDAYIVDEANQTDANIWWFSLNPVSPQLKKAISTSTPCAWLDAEQIVFFDGQRTKPVVNVHDIPITMRGAARYNIQNALAATCISRALGLSDDAISDGLTRFGNDPKDNPGRLNEFESNGARIFVDFAHNPHSIAAVSETVSKIPANRRFVMLSHAGDRSDQDIRDVTETALKMNPDFVVAVELADYLRGRTLGEVTQLIKETCKKHGLQPDQIISAESPKAGVEEILKNLQPGDLALLLVLSERDQVLELLSN